MSFEKIADQEVAEFNIEKMGVVYQMSGTIKLEGGGEISPTDSEPKTFSSNNGLLSFINEGGVQYVTKSTAEKVSELTAAGFKETSAGVPFSNMQKPLAGTADYDNWEKMIRE